MADLPQDDIAFNESPAFSGVNLFTSDRALQDAVAHEGASWAVADLKTFGGVAGVPRGLSEGGEFQ